jgi:hypothetical protein
MIATPGFRDITRERLELLCKFLHFSDNESQNTYQGPPKLFKIFPIISHLNNKFQTLYLPYHNISEDESLTLRKGRLSFKQLLPLKSSKYGIKSFEMCDLQTGYLWSVLIYTGKDTRIESPLTEQNHSHSYEADRASSEARSDCLDGQLLQLT